MRHKFQLSLPALAAWLVIAAAPSVAGCADVVPAAKFQAVQRDLQAAGEKVQLLETQASAQQQTIRSLREQIQTLRNVKGDPAEILIVPEKIQLASMCGGYDADGRVGDEGVVLYVQPVDRDGHVVKAAGMLTIQLIDPLNPPGAIEFAKYHFDAPHTRELWYGRLMTNHFTVKCPWPQGHLPAHNEIIAHVVFTELITGKSLTATGTYQITLPPQPPEAAKPG